MESRRDSPLWGQLTMPSTLRLSDRKENCNILVTKLRENVDVALQACVPKNFTLTRLPAIGVDQQLSEQPEPAAASLGHISIRDQPPQAAATEQPQQQPQQKLSRRLTTPAPVLQQEKKKTQEQPVAASRHSHRLAGRRAEGVVKKKVPWKMASPPRNHPKQQPSPFLPCASPNTAMCLSAASVLLSLAGTAPNVGASRHDQMVAEMHHQARLHMENKGRRENKDKYKEGVFYQTSSSLLIRAPTEHTLPFAVISPPLHDENHRQMPTVAVHGEGSNSPWGRRRGMFKVHYGTPPVAYNLSNIVPFKEELYSPGTLLPVKVSNGGTPALFVCAPPSAGHPFGSSRRKRSQSPAPIPFGGEGGSAEKRMKSDTENGALSLLCAANDLLSDEAAPEEDNVAQLGTPSPSPTSPAQVKNAAAAPSPAVDGGFLQFSNVSEALVGSDLLRRWLSLQMERVNQQMHKNPGDTGDTNLVTNGLLLGVSPSRLETAAGATAFPVDTYDEMLPVLRQCGTMKDVQMLVRGLQQSGGLEQLVLAGNAHVMLSQRDKEVSAAAAAGGGGGEAEFLTEGRSLTVSEQRII